MPALGKTEEEEEEEEDAESKDPLPEKLQNSMVNFMALKQWAAATFIISIWVVKFERASTQAAATSFQLVIHHYWLYGFAAAKSPIWVPVNSNYKQKINSPNKLVLTACELVRDTRANAARKQGSCCLFWY